MEYMEMKAQEQMDNAQHTFESMSAEIERLTAALAERQAAIEELHYVHDVRHSIDAGVRSGKSISALLLRDFLPRETAAWLAASKLATPVPAEQDDDEITAHPKGWHSTPKDFPS